MTDKKPLLEKEDNFCDHLEDAAAIALTPWSLGANILKGSAGGNKAYSPLPTGWSVSMWLLEFGCLLFATSMAGITMSESHAWNATNTGGVNHPDGGTDQSVKDDLINWSRFVFGSVLARLLLFTGAMLMNVVVFSRTAMFSVGNLSKNCAPYVSVLIGVGLELASHFFVFLSIFGVHFVDSFSNAADQGCALAGYPVANYTHGDDATKGFCHGECAWAGGIMPFEQDSVTKLSYNLAGLFYGMICALLVSVFVRTLRNVVLLGCIRGGADTLIRLDGQQLHTLATNMDDLKSKSFAATDTVETTYGLSGLRRVDLKFT